MYSFIVSRITARARASALPETKEPYTWFTYKRGRPIYLSAGHCVIRGQRFGVRACASLIDFTDGARRLAISEAEAKQLAKGV